MSTTSESSAVSSPSSTSTTGDKFTGGSNSNLYLVTFLATLFLLLFISCAIVLRSYVLRRRFQRQLDDAMAAGILLAPRAQGSRRRRFGVKPKFYNAWLSQGGDKWNDMMPIAALHLQVKRRSKAATTSSSTHQHEQLSQIPSTSPVPSQNEPSSFRTRLFHAIRRRDGIATQPITASKPEKSPKPRMDMLQVSVLVAMPSVDRPLNDSTSSLCKGDEERIPEVVLGVTRLPYNRQTP